MLNEIPVSKAAELANLTPGQVSSIIFEGFVTPDVHLPNGSGDHSVLSKKNIRELRLIGKLKRAGIKASTIRSITKLLKESKLNWWKGGKNYVALYDDGWLVTDNVVADLKRLKFNSILIVKLD